MSIFPRNIKGKPETSKAKSSRKLPVQSWAIGTIGLGDLTDACSYRANVGSPSGRKPWLPVWAGDAAAAAAPLTAQSVMQPAEKSAAGLVRSSLG